MKNKRKPVIEFTDFSGGQNTNAPLIGVDTKFSPDCLNVYAEGPVLKKRKGFTDLNTGAVSGNPNGNGLYNLVRSPSVQYLYALFGNEVNRMGISGSEWDGSWSAISPDATNGTNISDSLLSWDSYQGVLIMATDARDKPQRITATESSYFDVDFGGVGTSPFPKFIRVWKNHLWMMNLGAAGDLSDECASLASWDTSDCVNTGAVTTVTEDGLTSFKIYAGATDGDDAIVHRDVGNIGDNFEVEVKIKASTLSDTTAGDIAIMDVDNGVVVFKARWGDDALQVYDGAAWGTVGVGIVSEGSWSTWKFAVTGGTVASAVADIYKDGNPIGLQVDCSNASASTVSDGKILLSAEGSATAAERAEVYTDYIYISTIAARSDYVTGGIFTTWTAGTGGPPDDWTILPAQPHTHFKMNDAAANTTVTDDGSGGNNGTLNVNTDTIDTTGKVSTCFNFNGTSNFIECDAVQAAIADDTAGAVSLWFDPDTISSTPTLFMLASDSLGQDNFVIRVFEASTRIQVFIGKSPAGIQWTWYSDSLAVTAGNWHHFVVSHNGTEPSFWLNGVAHEGTFTDTVDVTAWIGASDSANQDIGRIGCFEYNGGAPTSFWDGRIDDFRYYQTSVGSAEVNALYNGGYGNEGYGVAVQEGTTFKQGTYSAEIQNTGTNAIFTHSIASPGSISGQDCYVGAWINATNNATYNFQVDDGDTVYTGSDISGNGAWQYQYYKFTTISNSTSIDIQIRSSSAATVYVDAVSVVIDSSITISSSSADRVQRTAINTYNDFTGTDSGTNDLVTPGDVGVTGNFVLNDKMYVTKKFSIHRFTYTGSTPLVDIKQIISDVGTNSPRTIKNVVIPGQGEVVIYLGTDKHLYMFDGWDRTKLTGNMFISNGLADVYMENVNGQALDKAHSVVHAEKNWYEIFLPMGDSVVPSYSIVFNYITKALWPNSNRNFRASALCDNGAGVRKVYALESTSGHCVLTNNATSDDGTSINAHWTSFKIGDPTVLVKMDEVSIQAESVVVYSAKLAWRMDYETDWVTKTLSVSSNDYNYNPKRLQNLAQIKLSDDSGNASFAFWAVRFLERVLGIAK